MRLSLAIAVLAAVLLARVDAHAGSAPVGSDTSAEDAYVPLSRIVIERCGEQPMSLALQIAEAEAARDLTARSLTSLDEPVVATPASRPVQPARVVAAAPKPFSPTPHACTSPGEPGCEVSAPFQAPHHTQLPHAAHDGALLGSIPDIEPPGVVELAHPSFRASDAPTAAHAPPPWRPPAR